MKTKITLTVEIEHNKNTSIETIKKCLTTAMKETYTNEMEVVDVSFPEENKTLKSENDYLKKQLAGLHGFVSSLPERDRIAIKNFLITKNTNL